jgi:glycosyltransferase involved in cell wall biosynthesis
MADNKPRVSIGMPVYNGEEYIRQALDSLLAQDYGNFELVISDNASTDRTQEICHEYAMRDKRIRYYRNETNLGAVANFNRVFELSKGTYFMWAGAHDLHHPAFITRCLRPLVEDASIVLVYPRAVEIDAGGHELGPRADALGAPLDGDASMRFCRMLWEGRCTAIYGIIRAASLRRSRGIRNTPGPDRVLLGELSLIGSFTQVPDVLLYLRRTRPAVGPTEYMRIQARALYPNSAKRFVTPYLHPFYRMYAFIDVVLRSNLSAAAKTRCAWHVVRWSALQVGSFFVYSVFALSPRMWWKCARKLGLRLGRR